MGNFMYDLIEMFTKNSKKSIKELKKVKKIQQSLKKRGILITYRIDIPI